MCALPHQHAPPPHPQKHTSESASLRTQVTNLQSQLDALQQQAQRLKAVEKQLDRSQLALEELQQAHDVLLKQHGVLQQRASRAVAVNWSAMVPDAWLDKVHHAVAPVQPTLQAAWKGVRETTESAWVGVHGVYVKYAPIVVAHVHSAWQHAKLHSRAAWDAGIAYAHNSGLVCCWSFFFWGGQCVYYSWCMYCMVYCQVCMYPRTHPRYNITLTPYIRSNVSPRCCMMQKCLLLHCWNPTPPLHGWVRSPM